MSPLFAKDLTFYEVLESQAQVAHKASEAFYSMVEDFNRLNEHAKIIDNIEHEGDRLAHQLANKLHGAFITPLDKEDLRDLSQALDDITDCIEAAAARAALYKLKGPRPDLEPLVSLLVQSARAVSEAVSEIKNGFKKSLSLKDTLVMIHSLENQSDRAFRNALAALFEQSENPLDVIKWKEIYDRIETAVDKCEDVAKIIGNVIVKYA